MSTRPSSRLTALPSRGNSTTLTHGSGRSYTRQQSSRYSAESTEHAGSFSIGDVVVSVTNMPKLLESMASSDPIVQQDAFWLALKFLLDKGSISKMIPSDDHRSIPRFLDTTLQALKTANNEVQNFSLKCLYLFTRLVDIAAYEHLRTLIYQVLELLKGKTPYLLTIVTHGVYFFTNLNLFAPSVENIIMTESFLAQLCSEWTRCEQREEVQTEDVNFVFLNVFKKISENKASHSVLSKPNFINMLLRVLKSNEADMKRLCLDILVELSRNRESVASISKTLKPGDFSLLLKALENQMPCLLSIASLAKLLASIESKFASDLCSDNLFLRNLFGTLKSVAKYNGDEEPEPVLYQLLECVLILVKQDSLEVVRFGLYPRLAELVRPAASSRIAELILEILLKASNYFEDYEEYSRTDLLKAPAEFLKLSSTDIPRMLLDFYIKGGNTGFNTKEIVTMDTLYMLEQAQALAGAASDLKRKFQELKYLLDNPTLAGKLYRPSEEIYKPKHALAIDFVRDLYPGSSETKEEISGSNEPIETNYFTESKKSLVEQLELKKNSDLDDLLERYLGLNLIVFSKKQRVENPLYSLQDNHYRMDAINGYMHPKTVYATSVPGDTPKLTETGIQENKPEDNDRSRPEKRLETPNFTATRFHEDQQTKDYNPHHSNLKNQNANKVIIEEEGEAPVLRVREDTSTADKQEPIVKERNNKPILNKGSFMDSYKQSLHSQQASSQSVRNTHLHKPERVEFRDNPSFGVNLSGASSERGNYLGSVHSSGSKPPIDSSGRVAQIQGRKRPSAGPYKSSSPSHENQYEHYPESASHQTSATGDVIKEDSYGIEQIRKQYENTSVDFPPNSLSGTRDSEVLRPERQSASSNQSRMDTNRILNTENSREGRNYTDRRNVDASLTLIGSHNLPSTKQQLFEGNEEVEERFRQESNYSSKEEHQKHQGDTFGQSFSTGRAFGGVRTSQNFSGNSDKTKELKQLLPPITTFLLSKLDGVDQIVQNQYMSTDFSDKDHAQSKALRHQLKIGITEAKSIARVTGVSNVYRLIEWFSTQIASHDNADVIYSLQRGIGSSTRTAFITALLIVIGERNGISFEKLRSDDRYNWA